MRIDVPIEKELPKTPEILVKLHAVRASEANLYSNLSELMAMAKTAQESCVHTFVPEKGNNSQYGTIFIGNRCTKCGFFVPSTSEYPWEICHNCGGKMKYDETASTQGRRLHTFVCEKCGQKFAHGDCMTK